MLISLTFVGTFENDKTTSGLKTSSGVLPNVSCSQQLTHLRVCACLCVREIRESVKRKDGEGHKRIGARGGNGSHARRAHRALT